MTLIVGVKCSDGIVMGADGAATSGTMGTQTIRQQVRKKLKIVADSIVVGTSGPVGLGQRFADEVETHWKTGLLFRDEINQAYRTSAGLMTFLRGHFWKHIDLEIQIARAASQVLPLNLTMVDALATTLIAIPVPNVGAPSLSHFDPQAFPEEASDDLPFFAVGSGQLIADPFLAFMRRLFCSPRSLRVRSPSTGPFTTLSRRILVGWPIPSRSS